MSTLGDNRAELEANVRAEWAAGRLSEAATRTLQGYGPEVLGMLVAVLRDHEAASEVFAQFCEDLWKGLPRFRWESSIRTWAYALARHAAFAYRRDPHRRRRACLSDHPEIERIEAHVRTATAPYLRSDARGRVNRLRASLDPDDQLLLILRIDRQMSWNDVAVVMGGAGDLARTAASLRKRFERLKERLRFLMESDETLAPIPPRAVPAARVSTCP